MTTSHRERYEECRRAISADVIDVQRLRRIAFRGVPDAHRRDYWAVLLGYLPPQRREWPAVLKRQRDIYTLYAAEFIGPLPPETPAELDRDPSSTGALHHDPRLKKLLESIDLDLPRTLPAFDFFHNCRPMGTPAAVALPMPSVDLGHGVVRFSAPVTALRNILFIYGVLNAAVGYVQGMNELLAPLYYVVYTSEKDPLGLLPDIEADTFFLFSIIMGHLRENFVRSADTQDPGVQLCIQNMADVLQVCDKQLHASLTEKVPHHLYAFRWVTLLFSQEFVLPDVLLLWDGLFADPHKFAFLFYLCAAVLMLRRDKLLAASSSDILADLQDIRHTVVVADVARTGRALYRLHGPSLVRVLNGGP